MTFPIVLDNILPLKTFWALHDDLKLDWIHNNTSAFSITKSNIQVKEKTWGKYCRNNLVYFQASSYIKLKIMRYLKIQLSLIKIHFNAQTSFQETAFHTDFDDDNVWTVILFSEPEWNIEWGGEFVVFDRTTNRYNYVPYIPNSAVLIPSNWEHKGTSPNSLTSSLRTTVAFSYCCTDIFETMRKKYKIEKFI